MARPEASAAAEAIYAVLDPAFTANDEENDWVALKLVMSLSVGVLDALYEYVIDHEDRPGWQLILDPDRAPAVLLPWQAQFGGATLRPDMTEEDERNAIKSPEAFKRGTIEAIRQVAQRRLTGTKAVVITERYVESAWKLQISTLEAETPEPAVTEAEIRAEQKPIGILLFFNRHNAITWKELRERSASNTWLKVREKYPTWFAARTSE